MYDQVQRPAKEDGCTDVVTRPRKGSVTGIKTKICDISASLLMYQIMRPVSTSGDKGNSRAVMSEDAT